MFVKILENEICKFGRNFFFQFFRMVKTKIEVKFQPFSNRFMPQKPTFIT